MEKLSTKKLEKLEEKLKKLKQEEQELKQRRKEIRAQLNKEKRKQETRLKIQIGAIFMKYFDISSLEEAESVARQFAAYVREHKHYQKNKDDK